MITHRTSHQRVERVRLESSLTKQKLSSAYWVFKATYPNLFYALTRTYFVENFGVMDSEGRSPAGYLLAVVNALEAYCAERYAGKGLTHNQLDRALAVEVQSCWYYGLRATSNPKAYVAKMLSIHVKSRPEKFITKYKYLI